MKRTWSCSWITRSATAMEVQSSVGRAAGARTSVVPAALERAAQRQVVYPFQVAPGGKALSQPGHRHVHVLEEAGQVDGGGLALDVGVGREHDLPGRLLADPLQQGADVQVVRSYVAQRGQRTAENVVDPAP